MHIMMDGGTVFFVIDQAACYSLFTAEAEDYVVRVAGVDIICVLRLLDEMSSFCRQQAFTISHDDNTVCSHMSCISVMYHKARYIGTRVYRFRKCVETG